MIGVVGYLLIINFGVTVNWNVVVNEKICQSQHHGRYVTLIPYSFVKVSIRFLKRCMCPAAPRPVVTRVLKYDNKYL